MCKVIQGLQNGVCKRCLDRPYRVVSTSKVVLREKCASPIEGMSLCGQITSRYSTSTTLTRPGSSYFTVRSLICVDVGFGSVASLINSLNSYSNHTCITSQRVPNRATLLPSDFNTKHLREFVPFHSHFF